MKIIRKTYLGKKKTCDVVGSGTGNFILYNGVITHNSALGYNLYAAVIDEANFLEVVEGSKRGQGLVYDAAENMYNAVYDRMVSRFMRAGKVPGFIVMISSRKSRESFMEKKIIEGLNKQDDPKSGIFFKVKSLWEAKPDDFFPSKKYFYVNTDTMGKIQPAKGKALYNLQKKLLVRKMARVEMEVDDMGLV